jgi:hypothetical protein
VLDGIAAAAAHAHHLDAGPLVEFFDHLDRHVNLLFRRQAVANENSVVKSKSAGLAIVPVMRKTSKIA